MTAVSGSDWETERGQAVQLLNDAADRIEETAQGFQAEFWQREIRNSDLSVGGAAWAMLVGPPVAPFLSGWLRHTARVTEVLAQHGDFQAYVDRKALGLAQHVMNQTTTAPAGE